MPYPPITVWAGTLFQRQINRALTYIEDNSGGGGGTPDWGSVTGKPTTFPPSAHSHAISDVTGLQTALDGKASVGSGGASPIIAWVI
jgi:hypothetical protein